MSLPQRKRTVSRKGSPLSFSAGKSLILNLKGGTEQVEATKKSHIFKRPLHCDCGGRFFFAPAQALREQS